METDLRDVKAFWITPDGEIHPVDTNHISYMPQNSALFNVSSEYLYDVFRKHREKSSFERLCKGSDYKGPC